MPRRLKYTPERVAAIERAIAMGATYRLACKYAGISEDTFARWRKSAEFAERLEKAEGAAALGWLAKIERAANEGTWQAAAWKLERLYPQEYGRTVQEFQGRGGGPIEQRLEGTVEHTGGITVRALDYREAIRPLLPRELPDDAAYVVNRQEMGG